MNEFLFPPIATDFITDSVINSEEKSKFVNFSKKKTNLCIYVCKNNLIKNVSHVTNNGVISYLSMWNFNLFCRLKFFVLIRFQHPVIFKTNNF